MAAKEPVVFTPSPERDPDGSQLHHLVVAHLACQRAGALRQGLLIVLGASSFLLAPCAAWPGAISAGGRGGALLLWWSCLSALAIAAGTEWRWSRERIRRASGLGGFPPPLAPTWTCPVRSLGPDRRLAPLS